MEHLKPCHQCTSRQASLCSNINILFMVKSIQYYPLLFVDIPGAGIAINSMCVNEAFCVTGSDDGFLRLWPLDFKHVYLEAGRFRDVDVNLELCV